MQSNSFLIIIPILLLVIATPVSATPVKPTATNLSPEKQQVVEDHTYDDVPPLTFAVSSGALEEVEALLEAGFPVDKKDWLGQTALHMAAKFQQYECARALLIYGANHSIANKEYEETALHLAAKTGTLDIMQLLIDYGADVNAEIAIEFIPGGTPLLYAALYDIYSSDAVRLLLENGADVTAMNSYRETALHVSVRNQNIQNIQLMLDVYQADVDAGDLEGCTPLNIFSRDITAMPQIAIAGLLIDHGSNIEARCRKSGRTPLHNAVASLNLPVIDYLLKRGADIEAVDWRGLTPLFTAVVDIPDIGLNHVNFNTKINVIRILLQNGANPNAAIRYNTTDGVFDDEEEEEEEQITTTAFHTLKKPKKCLTILVGLAVQGTNNAEDIARLLVAYGAELNASLTLCPENDPIEIARLNGHTELSDILWALKVDRKRALGPIEKIFINDRLSHAFDLHPFIMAIYAGDMKQVARQLLTPLTISVNKTAEKQKNSAIIDKKNPLLSVAKAKDYLGQTALHAAVACKSLTVARVLLHLGADVNAQDILGATPLHYAARSGFVFMAELLLQYGAKLDHPSSGGSPLVYAVSYANSPEMVQFLLEQGADVNKGHSSLLHIATTRQNIRMMKLLLEYGADINAKAPVSQLTPLGNLIESDCCYPQIPVLSFLLDHGANIDARDVNMRTPLNAALALKKRKQVVSFLLNRGANPNASNRDGCNAPLYRVLRMAKKKLQRYYRHSMSEEEADGSQEVLEIVNELLARGADPTFVDRCSQETALDVAHNTNQSEIYEILIEAIEARLGTVSVDATTPQTIATIRTTTTLPVYETFMMVTNLTTTTTKAIRTSRSSRATPTTRRRTTAHQTMKAVSKLATTATTKMRTMTRKTRPPPSTIKPRTSTTITTTTTTTKATTTTTTKSRKPTPMPVELEDPEMAVIVAEDPEMQRKLAAVFASS